AESDNAVGINLPLMVIEQLRFHAGHGLHECVERRRSAPFEVIVPVLYEGPVAANVARTELRDSLPVALLNCDHFTEFCLGSNGIAITPADMRHVDSEHPKQAAAFTRGDLSERVEKSRDSLVVFR